jgi:hypothetical protein
MITQDPIDRRWLVLAFAMIGVAGLAFGLYGLYESLYPPEPYPMTLERSSGGSATFTCVKAPCRFNNSEELRKFTECLQNQSLLPQVCRITTSEDE